MKLSDIEKINPADCKRFSDIAPDVSDMPGVKKRIVDVLNHDILIVDFRVMDSKHHPDSKCLEIQFVMNGETCVLFTGSMVLLDRIVPHKENLPFVVRLTKRDNYYAVE